MGATRNEMAFTNAIDTHALPPPTNEITRRVLTFQYALPVVVVAHVRRCCATVQRCRRCRQADRLHLHHCDTAPSASLGALFPQTPTANTAIRLTTHAQKLRVRVELCDPSAHHPPKSENTHEPREKSSPKWTRKWCDCSALPVRFGSNSGWLAAAAVAVASSNLCPHPPAIGVVVVVGDPALTLHIINQSARRQSAIRQTLRMRARGVKGLCDENTATQYWHDRLFGWPGLEYARKSQAQRWEVVCLCVCFFC